MRAKLEPAIARPSSRQIKIFLVLPRRDVRHIAGLPVRLSASQRAISAALMAQVIIDEDVAEARAETSAVLQRGQRLGERLRQRLG